METWLHNEILDGLSKVLCLRLVGTPPDDVIEGTAAAWYEAITAGRAFERERDVPRIRAAFRTLMATRETWPAPRHFIEALPKIEQAALGYEIKPADPQRAADAIREATAMLKPNMAHGKVQADKADPVVNADALAAVERDLREHYGKVAAAGPDA